MSSKYLLLSIGFAVFLASSPAFADEVKLTNGETVSGQILFEGEDFIRIEVAISDTIKETKTISRSEIAEIFKEAPDLVEFRKIEALLPSRPLLGPNQYRSMINVGPDAFLSKFPDSEHVARVKEIKAALEEELDKAERGFIKLDEEWVSPQERAEFPALIGSRIRLFQMTTQADGGNLNSFINAMREFEIMERDFSGTPAHVEAIELARSIVPSMGRQLQGMIRDVEYRNAEFERNKANMDDIARQQVEAARAREEEAYKAAAEADKKAGLKWVRVNPMSKASLEAYLKMAGTENVRIQELDLAPLRKQATLLEEADRLVSKDELDGAQRKLNEAAEVTGVDPKKKSSSRSKSGTYLAAVKTKLDERIAERSAAAKARAEAAKAAAIVKGSGTKKGASRDNKSLEEGEPQEGETADGAETESPEEEADDFAALAAAPKKSETKAKGSSSAGQKKTSSPAKAPARKAEPDERPVVADTGGGFPGFLIIPIVTVLLLVTLVILKLLGIGGKKDATDEE